MNPLWKASTVALLLSLAATLSITADAAGRRSIIRGHDGSIQYNNDGNPTVYTDSQVVLTRDGHWVKTMPTMQYDPNAAYPILNANPGTSVTLTPVWTPPPRVIGRWPHHHQEWWIQW
jgi:hypothetical protein